MKSYRRSVPVTTISTARLPAARAQEPISPIENAGSGAITPGHMGRVGLDLVAARLAPHDQPHLGVRCVAKCHRRAGRRFHEPRSLIPEIDIWRAAQLMLKRYGDNALEESAARANELALAGDDDGATTWRRIMAAVEQLANKTPPGQVH